MEIYKKYLPIAVIFAVLFYDYYRFTKSRCTNFAITPKNLAAYFRLGFIFRTYVLKEDQEPCDCGCKGQSTTPAPASTYVPVEAVDLLDAQGIVRWKTSIVDKEFQGKAQEIAGNTIDKARAEGRTAYDNRYYVLDLADPLFNLMLTQNVGGLSFEIKERQYFNRPDENYITKSIVENNFNNFYRAGTLYINKDSKIPADAGYPAGLGYVDGFFIESVYNSEVQAWWLRWDDFFSGPAVIRSFGPFKFTPTIAIPEPFVIEAITTIST